MGIQGSMKNKMSFLFEPGKIGKMEILNRLVRSATAERMARPDGTCGPQMEKLYSDLAEGGAGLIILGHACVQEDGRNRLSMTGIYNDSHIPGLRKIADTIHTYGAKAVSQINHAGRQTTPAVIGKTPLAPSAVTNKVTGLTPHAMTRAEIEETIEAFGQAARRARTAGFDAVQIHGAHGFLISAFNSPYTNTRQDEWGGTAEKRMRFITEVYREVRRQVGDDYPLLIKLNADDCLEGGITVEEISEIAIRLQRFGIDAIEISGGMAESKVGFIRAGIDSRDKEAYFLPYAKRLKEFVSIPLLLVGGIRSLEVADKILDQGWADFISLSRPLLREPNLPNAWQNGRTDKAACISCGKCSKYPERFINCEVIHPGDSERSASQA
jgi:2,4-dienoyl-CoA reductase-like NADH-dependent reductase (Old Yellow Enzyme family)